MASKLLKPTAISKSYNLFVANLCWTTGQNELKKHFEKFGSIIKTSVVFDKETGLSKGYGFVIFNKPESLESALASQNQVIDGRKIYIAERSHIKE